MTPYARNRPARPRSPVDACRHGAGPRPATPAPAAEDATGEGREIVVTARRVGEDLQKVPGSVSAFSEKTLERIRRKRHHRHPGLGPNLNLVQGRGSSSSTNIFIRGVGRPDALQTFDPAVGPMSTTFISAASAAPRLDLPRHRAHSRNAAAPRHAHGKNTIGGALKVVTAAPGEELRPALGDRRFLCPA